MGGSQNIQTEDRSHVGTSCYASFSPGHEIRTRYLHKYSPFPKTVRFFAHVSRYPAKPFILSTTSLSTTTHVPFSIVRTQKLEKRHAQNHHPHPIPFSPSMCSLNYLSQYMTWTTTTRVPFPRYTSQVPRCLRAHKFTSGSAARSLHIFTYPRCVAAFFTQSYYWQETLQISIILSRISSQNHVSLYNRRFEKWQNTQYPHLHPICFYSSLHVPT